MIITEKKLQCPGIGACGVYMYSYPIKRGGLCADATNYAYLIGDVLK